MFGDSRVMLARAPSQFLQLFPSDFTPECPDKSRKFETDRTDGCVLSHIDERMFYSLGVAVALEITVLRRLHPP